MKLFCKLTLEEAQYAASKGVERHWNALVADADAHKYGFDGDNLHAHIDGCMSEKAAAKMTGAKWDDGPWKPKSWDVGKLQVRSTKHKNGCLLIRPNDDDNDVFLLVIDDFPSYRLVGWLPCKLCKQEKWRRAPNNRPPAWFVPQDVLRKIEDLPKYENLASKS